MKSSTHSTGGSRNDMSADTPSDQRHPQNGQTLHERVQQFESTCRSLREQLGQAREQLLQANKMSIVGQMMSSVTHELNSPLNSVLGYTQLLLQKVSDEEVRGELHKIESAAMRSIKIIQSLLAFVRQHTPERQRVDVNEIVADVLEMQAHHRRINNIHVSLSLDPTLPHTVAEPHQIGQVVLNLITNAEQAVTASSGQRKIRISTTSHPGNGQDMIRVTIRDNGTGIPDEAMQHIFDPFFTTKEKGKGTGLGLAICQQIVSEHHGRLSAASGLGQGTVFTLELPVVAVEAHWTAGGTAGADTSPTAAPPGYGLVIDDEEAIREFVKEALITAGHRVDVARSGMEAFDRIKEHPYDFIVCDLRMPEVSGQTFYDVVKNFDAALSRRIIFITGDTINLSTQRFFEKTGNLYIYKPFGVSDLVALVERAVAERP